MMLGDINSAFEGKGRGSRLMTVRIFSNVRQMNSDEMQCDPPVPISVMIPR